MKNIETLRVISTILLVAYHVVGTTSSGGMMVSDTSGWRMFSDLLIDMRMPMFAFIAGAVYALRPMSGGKIMQFWLGKFHRIILPGITAAAVFWVLGNMVLHNTFASDRPVYEVLLLSFGHFWFLQALLLLYLIVGIADTLMRYNATLILLVSAIGATFMVGKFAAALPPFVKLSDAVYLSPYFVLGMAVLRYKDWLLQHRTNVLLASAALLSVGAYLNLEHLNEFGHFSRHRLDAQSLSVGFAVILISYLTLPRIRFLEQISIYSFAIYLYHPLGTGGARRVLMSFGIDNELLVFTTGLAVGIALPCLLHMALQMTPLSSKIVLGLRNKPKAA